MPRTRTDAGSAARCKITGRRLCICVLCVRRKRLPDDLYFHAKGAKGAEILSIPLPPAGYSPLSQGENGPPQSPCRGRSQSQPTCAHTILNVPLRQVGRAKRRGWIVFIFPFSLFRSSSSSSSFSPVDVIFFVRFVSSAGV